jgi:phosphatidate cytidylyltransferase
MAVALAGAGALWLIDRLGVPALARAVFAGVALSTWCAVFVLLYAVERGGTARVGRPAGTLLCLILMGAAWFALMDLSRAGWWVLISALAVVWIADIAAYFAGRAFGKRKLAPHISPGKTWAGVIGAVLTVVVTAEFLAYVWPQTPLFTTTLVQHVSIATGVLLLCLLVAMSIVGDLFESLIKRQAGAKDSGTLLPGHGGVLDRIDALLPVLPALQLIRYGFAS